IAPGDSRETGPPWDVHVGRARADAEVQVDPAPGAAGETVVRAHLVLEGKGERIGDRARAELAELAATIASPVEARVRGLGSVTIDGEPRAEGLELEVETSGEALRRWAPSVALEGPVALRLHAGGPTRELAVHAQVQLHR